MIGAYSPNKIFKLNRGDSFEFVIDIPDKTDATKNYVLKDNVDVV